MSRCRFNVPGGKKDFLNVRFSGKRLSLWNISVDQQSQYTIRNLISRLAPNWLTNVKVIDLTFFWDRLFDSELIVALLHLNLPY